MEIREKFRLWQVCSKVFARSSIGKSTNQQPQHIVSGILLRVLYSRSLESFEGLAKFMPGAVCRTSCESSRHKSGSHSCE
jgi:hypothetical protein